MYNPDESAELTIMQLVHHLRGVGCLISAETIIDFEILEIIDKRL